MVDTTVCHKVVYGNRDNQTNNRAFHVRNSQTHQLQVPVAELTELNYLSKVEDQANTDTLVHEPEVNSLRHFLVAVVIGNLNSTLKSKSTIR